MRVLAGRYGWAAAAVGLAAGFIGWAFPPESRSSVWTGAAAALVVQSVCFVVLWIGVRRGGSSFIAAWASGMVLRLAALGMLGLWGVEALGLRAVPALLTLGAVLFVLVLLEAVALRPRTATARA